jgi:TolA-binding protein
MGDSMKSAHLRYAISAAALAGMAMTPAFGQRPASPEQQQIAILQQQLSASQASALRLEQRLSSIETQLQQLINQSEISGHRVSEVESQLTTLRTDVNSRLTAMESRPAPEPQSADNSADESPPQVSEKPKIRTASASIPEAPAKSATTEEAVPSDPGEDAYSNGFHLWQDGKYDQAIAALKSFVSDFPKHRRVSFARNLIGRALLDKGQPRPAAEALLANYRTDPKGERAPDSLFYLGQALMALHQPSQACKAYGELEDVYGPALRPDLKSLINKGKADAGCS